MIPISHPCVRLAVASLCMSAAFGAAQASTVQVYGILDVGVRHAPNLSVSEDAITKVDDGMRSRIGLRGTEEVAPGVKAFFRLEHSLRMDTGAQRESVFWDDKAWVGLDSKALGQVMLGRLRSPTDEYTNGTRFEAFMGHTLGASTGRAALGTDAWNNGVYYISPSWEGLMAGVGFSAGEGAVASSRGAHVEYTRGPLDVALAWQRDGESLHDTKSTLTIAGTYQWPALLMLATYARSDDVGLTDSGQRTSWSLGARVPLGSGQVRVSGRITRDDQLQAAGDRSKDVEWRHLGLGYHHPLSKRTSVNATMAYDQRKTFDAAGATLTRRSGPGFELGLRVAF
ncbi:porin [Aquabacterium sp. A3]|uniref:porin n=1 Tax=Aquabacterium sp. A3 TaxID=3132829 RepID=UPI003119A792